MTPATGMSTRSALPIASSIRHESLRVWATGLTEEHENQIVAYVPEERLAVTTNECQAQSSPCFDHESTSLITQHPLAELHRLMVVQAELWDDLDSRLK